MHLLEENLNIGCLIKNPKLFEIGEFSTFCFKLRVHINRENFLKSFKLK